MAELDLKTYLGQVDHAVESLREPENPERNQEIDAIQKQIRSYIEGITRVQSKQMHLAILAGLDELAPRIELLVQTSINDRPTDPAPAPEVELIPKSEKRPIF